jgi:hypothetical protein
MFGVADETGELKYGECFIQYSSLNPTNNNQRKFNIVTGRFFYRHSILSFFLRHCNRYKKSMSMAR